ncbi:hypothetical protein, partial [Paenibacillus odorifer]|uniref:hypothetical protein n=1 Tax=Paenibacillus odorifer TaxID=189426 RepID=UPI001C4AD69D
SSPPCNVRTQMALFHKFKPFFSAFGLSCSYSLKHTLLLFKITAISAMRSDTIKNQTKNSK